MRKQEFNSKLISLLPLDEVPVHVPLRRPRPLRFARLRVPVWNPYSRGRLSPAKSEDRKGGEGKTDANLTFFLSPGRPNGPILGMLYTGFCRMVFGLEVASILDYWKFSSAPSLPITCTTT